MQIDAKTPLAFVDLETTGTSARHNRVIEIGIVRVEGGVVVREYHTLLNPGTLVPAFFTSLTGISTAMLVDAPQFEEVALKVAELLDGALFIAHNAPFDYGFLGGECKRLGITFSYPYLCTAKLSRALFPRYRRHNLDSIIERFGLSEGDRHRALDDARVLHQFLGVAKDCLGEERVHELMQEQVRVHRLPAHIKEEMILALPERPGVYFFYGKNDELLYVGKSRRIRTRVRSHFAKDGLSGRGQDMLSEIRRIEHRETAGELGALLLKLHLIKTHKPVYNTGTRTPLCIAHQGVNAHGYATIAIDQADTIAVGDEKHIAAVFSSNKQAKKLLHEYAKEYELCPQLLDIEQPVTPGASCAAHELGQCKGACIGVEKHRHYNRRFREAFQTHCIKTWPFVGPVGIEEISVAGTGELFIINNWRLLAALHVEEGVWEEFVPSSFRFEYETYKMFSRELLKKRPKVAIRELTRREEVWLRSGQGLETDAPPIE